MSALEITIVILLSCGIWFCMTATHELGHVIALIITKYLFCKEFKNKLDIKVLIAFRHGHTDSPLYDYLVCEKRYSLIKFNAAAGYTLELSLILTVLIYYSYSTAIPLFTLYHITSIHKLTLCLNAFLSLFLMAPSICTSVDLKTFKHPETYVYNNEIINKGLLKLFDYIPLPMAIFTTIITWLVLS